MDAEEFMTGTRWKMLESIAEHERSASEVAKAVGSSVAHASQQLKLLEARSLITRTKRQQHGKGKPHQRYRIAKALAVVTSIAPGYAQQRTLSPTSFQTMLLNVLLWPRLADQYFLQKFLCLHEDVVAESSAIAISDAAGDELHLLLITSPEQLEHVRQKSKAVIEHTGEKRTIICWTHTIEEVEQGLAQGEAYYVNHLRKPHILTDPDQLLRRFL